MNGTAMGRDSGGPSTRATRAMALVLTLNHSGQITIPLIYLSTINTDVYVMALVFG
jgi:hypothetical protein